MKSSKMVLLLAVTMMSAINAAVNLEDYLFQDKVDAQGKTFLHQYAEHCDQETFKVELDLFNDIDKKILLEIEKGREEAEALSCFIKEPGEVIARMVLRRLKELVKAKDNNGETALEIFKRKNAVENPCLRCVQGMDAVQALEDILNR